MAEKGQFRIGFRGFHKDDVLEYIDDLKMAQTVRVRDLESRCEAAEETIAASVARAEHAAKAMEEAQAEADSLREQVAKLTALAKAYKQEILRLREQAEKAEEAAACETSELDDANETIRQLTEQNRILMDQNAKYRQVIGDMSGLVIEARVLSESYFENAHQRSVDTIQRLDSFLDDLKSQTKQSRFLADVQKKKGEGHIETLLSDIRRREEAVDPDSTKGS